jgi:hypothetical protein
LSGIVNNPAMDAGPRFENAVEQPLKDVPGEQRLLALAA